MAFSVAFRDVPQGVDVSVTQEDLTMAREIGILTPRGVSQSDFDPHFSQEKTATTWASKVSGQTAQESHNAEYLALVEEAEFLAFVDDHENMLDDLAELLQEDIDGSTNPWNECLPCEMWPVSDSTCAEIRITEVNDGFCLGSLKYDTPWRGSRPAPNVFIEIPNPDLKLDLHSFYKMDIRKNPPEEGITWRATKIYPKQSTSDMLESSVFTQIPTIEGDEWQDETATHVYRLPTPPNLIGTMIGRGGKNITSLIADAIKRSECSGHPSYGEPSITIKPTSDFSGCVVIFHEPADSNWHTQDIEWIISHFHC